MATQEILLLSIVGAIIVFFWVLMNKPLFHIKGQLTATQEILILILLGIAIIFFWVAAGIGCWTIVGWLK